MPFVNSGGIFGTFSNFFRGDFVTVYERRNKILEYLKINRISNVDELSKLVWSSPSSVRRDIKALETQGLVTQIYGGVMLPEYQNSVIPLNMRDSAYSAEKEQIAEQASKLIFDGATVMMDGSSTVRRIMKYISGVKDLKIITNNLKILSDFESPDVKIYCTGGLYNAKSNIFIGSAAENFIRGAHADILFFSSRAVSNDGVISDVSEEEISLRRVMFAHSQKKVFLCDSSKVGDRKTFTLCHVREVDHVISDKPLPWEN